MSSSVFTSPRMIRVALADMAKANHTLDLAVAFIGSEAPSILEGTNNQVRLVCWCAPGSTDPNSLRALMAAGHQVRHRSGMHAKVAIGRDASGTAAVALIGSANLSKSGLGLSQEFGRDEVAVRTTSQPVVQKTSVWFDGIWNSAGTKPVDEAILTTLDKAWKKAERRRDKSRQKAIEALELTRKKSKKLAKILEYVTRHDLVAMIEHVREVSVMRDMDLDALTLRDQTDIANNLATWYQPWLHRPKYQAATLGQLTAALRVLWNEDLDVVDRLRTVLNGPTKVRGLGIPMWTTLLYWRSPETSVPLNGRTIEFLQDIGLDTKVGGSQSVAQYTRWMGVSSELMDAFGLPTLGHVDRVVWFWINGLPES